MAVREVDVGFVKDSGPLKGRPMQLLTSRAMAKLRIQRLLSAQLKLDFPTVTPSLILSIEPIPVVVDLIRWACLPVVRLVLGADAVGSRLLGCSFRFLRGGGSRAGLGSRGGRHGDVRPERTAVQEIPGARREVV